VKSRAVWHRRGPGANARSANCATSQCGRVRSTHQSRAPTKATSLDFTGQYHCSRPLWCMECTQCRSISESLDREAGSSGAEPAVALLRSKLFCQLCRVHGHGWRPAGFGPPPKGPSPFLSTATKRDEKMPPQSSRYSCASRPGRGMANASVRAANAGHPWPAPAGLIRSGLRCSGGLKGKLIRLASYRRHRASWA